ncbi:MAG: hypothetical protein KAQ91_03895 [Methylococcales bacterium]|nr:hypothetical protein [Methylococcales bacterium]
MSLPNNVYSLTEQSEIQSLDIMDVRASDAKPMNIGTLSVELAGMGNEIDYFRENLSRVLSSQGIKVEYEKTNKPDITIKVEDFCIRNQRTSGFSHYI